MRMEIGKQRNNNTSKQDSCSRESLGLKNKPLLVYSNALNSLRKFDAFLRVLLHFIA